MPQPSEMQQAIQRLRQPSRALEAAYAIDEGARRMGGWRVLFGRRARSARIVPEQGLRRGEGAGLASIRKQRRSLSGWLPDPTSGWT